MTEGKPSRRPEISWHPKGGGAGGHAPEKITLQGGFFVAFQCNRSPFAFSSGPESERTPTAAITDAIALALSRLKTKGAALACKVVGAPASVQAVVPLLEKAGLSIEKKVEREGRIEIIYEPLSGRIRLSKDAGITVGAPHGDPLKVLIIDDSATIRKILTNLISRDPAYRILETVENEKELRAAILKGPIPDVVTLDLNMPGRSGIELLKDILVPARIPAVIVSSLALEEGPAVLSALEAGAVDYVQKPTLSDFDGIRETLLEKLKAAASAKVQLPPPPGLGLNVRTPVTERIRKKFGITPTKKSLPAGHELRGRFHNQLIAIGASTGGTEAIRQILEGLPEDIPPIVIVQHIPGGFSRAFADRLNATMPFAVREARDGDIAEPGTVLIAPGGYQMRVIKEDGQFLCRIEDTPPVNRHKPSVDVLFDSIAHLKHVQRLALILTGMGADGAAGLLRLKESGAYTVAQDEATSIVFGMPKEAARLSAALRIAPLNVMSGLILQWSSEQSEKTRKKNAA